MADKLRSDAIFDDSVPCVQTAFRRVKLHRRFVHNLHNARERVRTKFTMRLHGLWLNLVIF